MADWLAREFGAFIAWTVMIVVKVLRLCCADGFAWGARTYGATGGSWRLLRMGSDIVADEDSGLKDGLWKMSKGWGDCASLRIDVGPKL